MEPLLANVFENVGRIVLNILAIAGGFLIGNVLALILCRVLAKFVLKARLPIWVEGIARVLGGVIVAILVALLVFGDGGWGFGGSGGGRPGGPGGTSIQQKGETTTDPKDKPPIDQKPKVDPLPSDETIKVTIMRGSAFPKTFRFEGYTEAVDLETAKNMLRERIQSGKGKLKSVTFLLYANSTAPDGTVVEELKRFVISLDLDVTLSNIAQDL